MRDCEIAGDDIAGSENYEIAGDEIARIEATRCRCHWSGSHGRVRHWSGSCGGITRCHCHWSGSCERMKAIQCHCHWPGSCGRHSQVDGGDDRRLADLCGPMDSTGVGLLQGARFDPGREMESSSRNL
jgi:hypothetical protein